MNKPMTPWHFERAGRTTTRQASTEGQQFASDLHAALAGRPKAISPKYFYDEAGSRLFERICELPEYYPTRTETELLHRHAAEMVACWSESVQLVEYGAGALRKVRPLLDHLPRAGTQFAPVDISGPHLLAACAQLRLDYPGLEVTPVVADFSARPELPTCPPGVQRIGFFPGSSIGNFSPAEAGAFLRRAASELRGGGLLIGIDLIKDEAVLHAAYNDAAGVTAAFNRNLLARAQRELGAELPLEAFTHEAFFNRDESRIEMHLRAETALTVQLEARQYRFEPGERLHTENSYKYTVEGFTALASRAGFRPGRVWSDARHWFALLWLPAGN
jgi:dimethylhistidine N-methyltransferase